MKDIREFIFVNKLISEIEELIKDKPWKAYSFDVVGNTYAFYLYSIATGSKHIVNINTSGIIFAPGVPEWLRVSIIKIAEGSWTPEYWEAIYKLYERK